MLLLAVLGHMACAADNSGYLLHAGTGVGAVMFMEATRIAILLLIIIFVLYLIHSLISLTSLPYQHAQASIHVLC